MNDVMTQRPPQPTATTPGMAGLQKLGPLDSR
jgi:hypothetical protein